MTGVELSWTYFDFKLFPLTGATRSLTLRTKGIITYHKVIELSWTLESLTVLLITNLSQLFKSRHRGLLGCTYKTSPLKT